MVLRPRGPQDETTAGMGARTTACLMSPCDFLKFDQLMKKEVVARHVAPNPDSI